MKFMWTIILLGLFSLSHGITMNSVAANVGKFPITSYDIKKMAELMQTSGSYKTYNTGNAFRELLVINALQYVKSQNEQIKVREKDYLNYLESLTNTKGGDTKGLELYQNYSDYIKMQYEKNQIIRSMISVDQNINKRVNDEVPEKEIKDYYNKNRATMVEPPSVDVIAFVVPQPANLDLDALETFEKSLNVISDALKKSDDAEVILKKYKDFKFESYSGRSTMKNIYDLLRAGYPQEVIGVALSTNVLKSSKGEIFIRKGTVLGPEPIQFRDFPGKTYYLIFKLMDRQMSKVLTLEKASPLIERKLKEDRVGKIIETYLAEQMVKNEIPVTIIDNNYGGVYDEFIRR
jgi:hypothetical protein